MQILQPDIHHNVSAYAELGRKPSIAPANKECSTILSNRSLWTELSIDKNHLQQNGGSCIKRLPEVDYVRQRNKFFKNL